VNSRPASATNTPRMTMAMRIASTVSAFRVRALNFVECRPRAGLVSPPAVPARPARTPAG
jgi:hypothetical protein